MAWRIHHQVIRGELDNRIQGKVTGTIWLAERPEPIRLTLQGDPWRDWAGCVLRFTHPTPQAGQLDGFTSDQTGVCGDMTASRKVRNCARTGPGMAGTRCSRTRLFTLGQFSLCGMVQ